MFGYISIDKPEMKVRDFETFRAYYCGLCRQIRRGYGQLPRLVLSYDCTFLYILGAALEDSIPEYAKKRCPVSPIRKRGFARDHGAEYAAAVNVLLAADNLRDKVKDDKNLGAGAMLLAYQGAYRKAGRKYPRAAASIGEALERLSQMEREKESNLDKVADAFAGMLRDIFAGLGKHKDEEKVLGHLGYNLGRWIYLADAYHDRQRDARKGAYNPFLCRYGKDAAEQSGGEMKETAAFSLNSSLHAACAAYDLLEIKKHKEILDNILYSGLYKKTEQILKESGKET